ncbi:MAG: hypothetical protein SF066_22995 [Thermoanaerobaculia bacterium]|nr:hypothetical protein [Thermoanaerobaculia bacterium]
MTSEDEICFAGLDGATGAPLYPALAVAEAARAAIRSPPPRARAREAARVATEKRSDQLGTRYGIDPKNLAQTGWAAVFPREADPAVREALAPLLAHRQAQAAAVDERLFRVLELRPGEDKIAFLRRHGMGLGAADPHRVPYYVLLVGAPDLMPWEFQQDLALQYAVGRVAFDTAAEYARYAQTVVETEQEPAPRGREVAFFGVENPDDEATRLMTKYLVRALPGFLANARGDAGWRITTATGEVATKNRLARFLGGEETPALLVTTSHGMGFCADHPYQREHQGALVCHEWPGPRAAPGPIPADAYFAAEDLATRAAPRGLVAFHYACHGAGLPAFDLYPERSGVRRPLTSQPFVARLPQRLLGAERGGALAVAGHVERAFCWSFLWDQAGGQTQIFEDSLLRLLDGFPVGAAFEPFGVRHGDLAGTVLAAVEHQRFAEKAGVAPDDRALVRLWTAYHDAKSYAILGDPAVRLAV